MAKGFIWVDPHKLSSAGWPGDPGGPPSVTVGADGGTNCATGGGMQPLGSHPSAMDRITPSGHT